MEDKQILFNIEADYRSDNPEKPHYYVLARNKKEAKDKFNSKISWLKIYNVIICTEEIVKKVAGNPAKYLFC